LSGGIYKKVFRPPSEVGQWPESCGSWYGILLVVSVILLKVSTVLFHLIREGLLRTTEFSCDGSVGDAFRVILPKLDNGIGFRIKFTETSKELLQQLRSAITSSIEGLSSGM
jgi:hypothetical protein